MSNHNTILIKYYREMGTENIELFGLLSGFQKDNILFQLALLKGYWT